VSRWGYALNTHLADANYLLLIAAAALAALWFASRNDGSWLQRFARRQSLIENSFRLVLQLGIVCICLILALPIVFSWHETRESHRAEERRHLREVSLQLSAGIFLIAGGLLAVIRIRQADGDIKIKRSTEYTTRFAKCVELIAQAVEKENLTDSRKVRPAIELRMGALLAMRRLLKDSDQDMAAILTFIAAYLRDTAKRSRNSSMAPKPAQSQDSPTVTAVAQVPAPETEELSRDPNEPLRGDIQVALEVIAWKSRKSEEDRPRLNLSNCDFRRAILPGARFFDLDLSETEFGNSDFRKAEFEKVDAINLSLRSCDLADAKFEDCSIYGIFEGVNLNGCSFTRTSLADVDLRGLDFSTVRFSGIHLSRAKIEGAIFFTPGGESEFARGLTAEEVLETQDWTLAHFSPEFNIALGALLSEQEAVRVD
jgi:hypothetical protein